jgi:protein-S-isoprenylcysteine O-methyltransferase Ste14
MEHTMQRLTPQDQAQIPDHPDVVIFPPLILAAALAIACLLQALSPLGWLSGFGQDMRIAAGIVVAMIGFAIAASGRRRLVRAGTNVSPLRPTTALATGGIFRWTRNPLYTGGTLVMLGVAVIFALDWLVLLIVPSALVLHFGVVRREEQYLEGKFGDAYRQYKSSVGRYGLI